MTTISDENRKYLRKSMRVDCGFRETSDEPTSITPIGNDADFVGLKNFGHEHFTNALMDLGGDGFLNDGKAVPMQTDTDSFRYGYISESVTNDSGTFDTPFGVTITADADWAQVTLEVMDQRGTVQTMMFEPIWNAGQTTIYIDIFEPNERAYIVGVYLGKAWVWNNDNIISVSADLRGVNTEIGGELEVSTISIEAIEPNNPTDYIGTIPLGAPIWYVAGYENDASKQRNFYLSEVATWEDGVLKVQGQDASSRLDSVEIPWQWWTFDTGTYIPLFISRALELALDGIDHETVGTYPQLTYTSDENIYLDGGSARSIISLYTGFFRDSTYSRVTYVDAGRPCLTWGDNAKTYTIYADEISELKSNAAQNINDISVNLATYEAGGWETVETFDGVADRTYWFDFDYPVADATLHPWEWKSATWETNTRLKVVVWITDAQTDLKVKKLNTIIVDGENPYHATNAKEGISYSFDETLPSMLVSIPASGSLTKFSLPKLLDRSNVTYEFTYRGNPHIQPRDLLNVEIATWEDSYDVVDGLFPATDLYPSASLYPYAEYKKTRKMVKRWETMTVDSVSLEHREGGLTSTIKARKGVV